MKWDLTQLAPQDTIEEDLKKMPSEAEKFQKEYQGRIASLDAQGLKKFIEDRDTFYLKFEGPVMHARLAYYANALDPEAQRISDIADRAGTEAAQKLAFSSIELGKLLESNPALIEDPVLSEFLEEVALVSEIDNLSEDSSYVVLMTVHSAKGHEFPYDV